MLPFKTPANTPTPTVARLPGIFSRVKPRSNNIAVVNTVTASAMRMLKADSEASA